MQNQLTSMNSAKDWNSKRRYKVGQTVKVDIYFFTNTSGINSDPTLLNGWVYIGKSQEINPYGAMKVKQKASGNNNKFRMEINDFCEGMLGTKKINDSIYLGGSQTSEASFTILDYVEVS